MPPPPPRNTPPEPDIDSANAAYEWQADDEHRTTLVLPPWLPRQREAHKVIEDTLPESYTLLGFGGAMGGGKSHYAARMAFVLATSYPGNRGLVGRQELKNLKTTTEEEFFRICPPQFVKKRNEAEQWAAIAMPGWPEGLTSRVYFRNLENWKGLGSEQYGFVIIDEATETSVEAAIMLMTRLRWRLPKAARAFRLPECTLCGARDPSFRETGVCPAHGATLSPDGQRYYFIATFNPWPSWPVDWFYHRKLPPAIDELGTALRVRFVQSKAHDNPHNGPNYVAVQRALLAGQPGLAERLIDGRFDIFPGAVFELFDEDKHAWRAELPEFVRFIGGLDFGGESMNADETAGVLRGITKTGRQIRLSVFKAKGPDIDERHMMWMTRQQQQWGDKIHKKIEWCADKTQGRGIALMRKHGHFKVVPSKGGNDSVEAGVKTLAREMVFDATGRPGVYYWPKGEGMEFWLDEVKKYRRDPDTLKIVRGQADHTIDADRYAAELTDRKIGDPAQMFRGSIAAVR